MRKEDEKRLNQLHQTLIESIEKASVAHNTRDLRKFNVELSATDAFDLVLACRDLKKTDKALRSQKKQSVRMMSDIGKMLVQNCEEERKVIERIIEIQKDRIEDID